MVHSDRSTTTPGATVTEAVLARRTATLLRLVASSPSPMGLSEIARETTVPKATCIRILRALVDEQLLEVESDTRRYRISFPLMALMADRVQADGSIELLRRELIRLRNGTHESAGIDLLIDDHVVVVLQVEGPQLISQTGTSVPRRLPMLRTSTGKAFLAWQADVAITDAAMSPLDAIERDRLEKDLGTARRRGYAVARNELDSGAAAIAAPVIVDGAVVCTVWIGGPTFRLTAAQTPSLAQHVMESAERLTTLLRTGRAWLDDLQSMPSDPPHPTPLRGVS